MFDIATVGHLSIDSIYLPTSPKPHVVLGGSVAYFAISAQRLGASVSIISKVGSDFPKAYLRWLRQEGVDLSNVKIEGALTTRFELKYSGDLLDRALRLTARAPSINVGDVPSYFKAKAVHIAPIAGEINHEVVEKLSQSADFLSIDPQGLLRISDGSGNVRYGKLADKHVLELVDIYKSSFAEIACIAGVSDVNSAIRAIHNFGVKIVIVTLGVRGAILSLEGSINPIPAYNPEKVVDPTGAGDVFIAGFLTEYIQGKDSLWCAYVGSAMASVAVEAVGPTFSYSQTEIYRRAHALSEMKLKMSSINHLLKGNVHQLGG